MTELTPEQIAANEAKAIAEAEKAAEKTAKAEARALAAAEKKAAKEAAAAEKKAVKEAAKAAKEAEKQAKLDAKAAAVAAKAAAKAAKEADKMPEQNGVRRPRPGTLCGKAWEIADNISAKLGSPAPISDVLEIAVAEGLNPGNVKAEYARWRKYYGITGRIVRAKEEVPAEVVAETPAE